MRKIRVVLIAILIASGISFMSCRKNDNLRGDNPLNSLQNNYSEQYDAIADNMYAGIGASVESEVMMLNLNSFQNLSMKSANCEFACRIVTIDHPDTLNYPKIITIDYGTGCSVVFRDDTITRAGKIVITTTDKFYIPGSQHIVTFNNYRENNILVEGTFKTSFIGLDSNRYLEFSDTLVGGKLTINDTDTYTRNSVMNFQWYRAPDPFNDTVFISGSMNGINTNGENYSSQVVKKLKLVRCHELLHRWVIVDGQVVMIVGGNESTFNYTNTGCIGNANIQQGDQVYHISIRSH
jgi:hypothetical protein